MNKELFTKELLHFGIVIKDYEFQTIQGKFERIRIFDYSGKKYFHRMQNGETLEITEI